VSFCRLKQLSAQLFLAVALGDSKLEWFMLVQGS
jgi:hypothetical protein